MTAAQQQQQQQQLGPDPASAAHGAGMPPGFRAEQHDWVLQAIMELRGAVGELVGSQKSLTAAVENQSGKIDALRGELTSSIEKQSEGLRKQSEELSKLTGAISFAKWATGICIAFFTVLVALIGLVLYRLPAVIEAVLRVFRDSV